MNEVSASAHGFYHRLDEVVTRQTFHQKNRLTQFRVW